MSKRPLPLFSDGTSGGGGPSGTRWYPSWPFRRLRVDSDDEEDEDADDSDAEAEEERRAATAAEERANPSLTEWLPTDALRLVLAQWMQKYGDHKALDTIDQASRAAMLGMVNALPLPERNAIFKRFCEARFPPSQYDRLTQGGRSSFIEMGEWIEANLVRHLATPATDPLYTEGDVNARNERRADFEQAAACAKASRLTEAFWVYYCAYLFALLRFRATHALLMARMMRSMAYYTRLALIDERGKAIHAGFTERENHYRLYASPGPGEPLVRVTEETVEAWGVSSFEVLAILSTKDHCGLFMPPAEQVDAMAETDAVLKWVREYQSVDPLLPTQKTPNHVFRIAVPTTASVTAEYNFSGEQAMTDVEVTVLLRRPANAAATEEEIAVLDKARLIASFVDTQVSQHQAQFHIPVCVGHTLYTRFAYTVPVPHLQVRVFEDHTMSATLDANGDLHVRQASELSVQYVAPSISTLAPDRVTGWNGRAETAPARGTTAACPAEGPLARIRDRVALYCDTLWGPANDLVDGEVGRFLPNLAYHYNAGYQRAIHSQGVWERIEKHTFLNKVILFLTQGTLVRDPVVLPASGGPRVLTPILWTACCAGCATPEVTRADPATGRAYCETCVPDSS